MAWEFCWAPIARYHLTNDLGNSHLLLHHCTMHSHVGIFTNTSAMWWLNGSVVTLLHQNDPICSFQTTEQRRIRFFCNLSANLMGDLATTYNQLHTSTCTIYRWSFRERMCMWYHRRSGKLLALWRRFFNFSLAWSDGFEFVMFDRLIWPSLPKGWMKLFWPTFVGAQLAHPRGSNCYKHSFSWPPLWQSFHLGCPPPVKVGVEARDFQKKHPGK